MGHRAFSLRLPTFINEPPPDTQHPAHPLAAAEARVRRLCRDVCFFGCLFNLDTPGISEMFWLMCSPSPR